MSPCESLCLFAEKPQPSADVVIDDGVPSTSQWSVYPSLTNWEDLQTIGIEEKLLTDRIIYLLKSQKNEILRVDQVSSIYSELYKEALRPSNWNFSDVIELLESMESTLRILLQDDILLVALGSRSFAEETTMICCRLLMEDKECSMSLKDISIQYKKYLGQTLMPSLNLEDIKHFIQVNGNTLTLKPLLKVARNIILILQESYEKVDIFKLNKLYEDKFEAPIPILNIFNLLESLSYFFILHGKKQEYEVSLNAGIIGSRIEISSRQELGVHLQGLVNLDGVLLQKSL